MMNNNILGMEERAEKLNALLLAQEADFTIDYVRVWKNNVELEGYTLKSTVNNCAPTIYYHADWYNQEDNKVVSYLMEMNKRHACQIEVSDLTDRAYILSHIYPRIVSAENVKQLEERGISHIKFLDMYVLFYVTVSDFMDEEGVASMQVTDALLRSAGITIDEAYSKSLENLEKEVEVKSMQEVLFGELGMECEFGEMQIPIWVCTTKNRIQGAATMLCSSMLRSLEEKIGGKVAILPSSIHECLALPYDTEEELKSFVSMVTEVNDTQVLPEEKLTDSVYYVEDGELKLAS